MDKKKLEIIRDEVFNFLNEKDFEDISLFERFEIMNNVSKFLDPNNYEENIQILNAHIKK